MAVSSSPPSCLRPGPRLRWRHPRRAFALGLFNAYGPGPFEFIRYLAGPEPDSSSAVLIQTEFGEREINPLWVGEEEGCLTAERPRPRNPSP